MSPTLAQQLEAATKKITDLEAKVTELTTAAEEHAAQVKDLEDKLEASGKEKESLQADLSTSGDKVSALEEDLKKSKDDLATATADLEKVKGQLALTPGQADLSAGAEPVDDSSVGAGGDASGLWDQYNELKKADPQAATLFYRENEKAMKQEAALKMAAESSK